MKVIFAIPSMPGNMEMECHMSLIAVYRILNDTGISYDEFTISGCPCISTARNTLAAMFLKDEDATDLFFIDSDVGFDAAGAIKILERSEDIIAGIYPLKRDLVGYPVEVKTIDTGQPIGRDGLVEGNFLPGGFMRIKRRVFELMQLEYPNLKYTQNVIEVMDSGIEEAYDYFSMGVEGRNQRWTTEDYAFCQRWRDIGGQLWVYPNIDFTHTGRKSFKGNYHEHLLRQPGGIKGPPIEAGTAK